MKPSIKILPICLMTVALIAMVAVTTAKAATSLNGRLIASPVTPGMVGNTNYALASSTEYSGGLTTVGVGQPVYLEADVNISIPASAITNVTWSLTNRPGGSAAVLTNSPLGTNVPVFEPSDQLVYRSAGRMFLRPDIVGQYTVKAAIGTTNAGTTNVTLTITAGTYMGVNTCTLCHSGGQGAPNKVQPWSLTAHASMFANGIDGVLGSHYSASCIKCHTVGYDTNTNAVNGGFDDVAAQLGWTFPSVLTNSNWASMQTNYPTLANLANIQCENCHGPGSQHAYSLGNTNYISVSYTAGDCAQCHDSPTGHIKYAEWTNSLHAMETGPTSANCTPCHSAYGFITRMGGSSLGTNAPFAPIVCQTCHEPHGETLPSSNAPNPYLIRSLASVTMGDGTVVTNAGEGLLCLQCHHSRNGSAVTNIVNYQLGLPTYWGGSSFGPHDSPQGDMILGINAITYGQTIPSSAHRAAITNLCVACHMQENTANTNGSPGFLVAGGHTFKMSGINSSGTNVEMVATCQQCHGPITSFDMVVQDYNGDGVTEGVQEEVQHLLDQLSKLLPPTNYVASGNYAADGLVKSSISVKTNWPAKFLKAAYNWQFVNNDGSSGIHNAPFATGLLKASIADLTGDANNDGLPDAWQNFYFGFASNPLGAPNAINNTNGIPNWMMYALGLNPTQSGITVPGGVVWMNGNNLVNSGVTHTIAIYTAAEIAFNTTLNNTYQIQGIASLSGGWQNIGNPILGTGGSVSYLTPTRANAQMFFRVIINP